jgi:hypothetical protein
VKLPAWIEEILVAYDEKTTPHNEVEIAEAISTARKSKGDLSEEDFKVLLAEHSAFFFIDSHGESSRWGSYFAPMAELGRADGSTLLSPDIAELDDQTLEHWRDRARSAKNPVMRARYADLVWEFGRRLGDAKRDHSCALIAMEAYVEAANKQLYTYSIEGVRWVVRALDIATATNNKDGARSAADALLSLVASEQNLRNMGIWVAPFDYLYGKKGLLTPEQSAKVIADLEDILARTSVPNPEKNEFDQFGAQAAAERLAQYYRRRGEKAEVERVVKSYGGAFEFLAKEASPMLAMAWLQPVIERYEQENLKADAERVQILAAEKGANIASDLKTYSVEAEIGAEKIEAEIELLIEGDEFDKAMMRVADRFIPKTEFARRLVEDRKKTAPLLSMIKSVLVRSDGQPEAVFDPDDEEGTLHHQINQYMAFVQGILHHSLKRLFEKFSASAEDVVSFIYQSPIFLESRRALLQSGVQAYFDGDFIKAVHVLVPQVEDTLRSLAAKSGIPVYKTVRGASGITDVKSMNNILEDQRVRNMLTEDLWRYLTVLYIDRRGLNLRNDLAHGLINTESFNTLICDRVLHSLMVLGMMRPRPTEAEPAIEIADAIPAEKANE